MTAVIVDISEAPALTPWPMSLLDIADVETVQGIGWLRGATGAGRYMSMAAAVPSIGAFCDVQSYPRNGPDVVGSVEFSVNAALECSALGFASDADAWTRDIWDKVESVGVEMGLMANILSSIAFGTNVTSHYATITSAQQALAVLEAEASVRYNGVPTLHFPIPVVSLLLSGNYLDKQADGSYLSRLGSKIVAGRGYLTPTAQSLVFNGAGGAESQGKYWVYATGEVEVKKSEPTFHGGILTGDASDNTYTSLAQADYSVTVDSLCVALRVNALPFNP